MTATVQSSHFKLWLKPMIFLVCVISAIVILLIIFEVQIPKFSSNDNQHRIILNNEDSSGKISSDMLQTIISQLDTQVAQYQDIKEEISQVKKMLNDFENNLKPQMVNPPEKLNAGKPIFFMETSENKHGITAREACIMESAARLHPLSSVILYVIHPGFNWTDHYVSVLTRIAPNFWVKMLNMTELFIGTPLATWNMEKDIGGSRYPAEHLSDGLRGALMYKYGGIYLDTDMIIVNSMDYLKNVISINQDPTHLNSAALIFERGHQFWEEYLTEYVQHFNGQAWSLNGPELCDRLLQERCKLTSKSFFPAVNNPEQCGGVTILTNQSFYSIWWEKFLHEMPPGALDFTNGQYGVHLSGSHSRNRLTTPGNGCGFDKLFKSYCPGIYQEMVKDGKL